VEIPDHALASVTDYRRALDLSNGLVTASYVRRGVTYRREVYASHSDDAVVLSFTNSGGGTYTGRIVLAGTHGESVTAGTSLSFGGSLANNRRYGAAVIAVSSRGTIKVGSAGIEFTDCADLTVVLSGGTDYVPDFARGFTIPRSTRGRWPPPRPSPPASLPRPC